MGFHAQHRFLVALAALWFAAAPAAAQECRIALALGRVGDEQQRVVLVVSLIRSGFGVLAPERFDKLAFEGIEAGIGAGGGRGARGGLAGFIGVGTAG